MKFFLFNSLLAVFFLAACQNSTSKVDNNKDKNGNSQPDSSTFGSNQAWFDQPDLRPRLTLDDWRGKYEGTMKMYNIKQADSPHLVKIMVEIDTTAQSNEWVWRTSYESSIYGNSVKDYKLVQPDSFKGTPQYWTDENNGILLHNSYFDNTFYNFYTVNGAYYNCVFKRFGDLLFYDIYTAQNKQVSDYNMEDFKVISYPVYTSQSAVLKKVK